MLNLQLIFISLIFTAVSIEIVTSDSYLNIGNDEEYDYEYNNGDEEKRNERYEEYRGKSLLRFIPEKSTHLALLKRIEKRNKFFDIKFWTSPDALYRNVDVVVPYQKVQQLFKFTKKHGISLDVIHYDIKEVLKREESGINNKYVRAEIFNLDQFNSHNSTISWIEYIASQCKTYCQVINLGKSYEGRDLKLIKIGTAAKGIFIDGGIHAREWGAITSTLYLIKKLTDKNDALGQYLLSKYTFHIIPIANPDGYEFSRKYSREWRKTRTTMYSRYCPGVDPNRNFGIGFGGEGSSKNPCEEIYMGPKAFSEPETRSIYEYIMAERSALAGYLASHSYGRMIVYPWGCNESVTYDTEDLKQVAFKMKSEIKKYTNTDYTYGPTAILLYIASGGSDDWAKGEAKIKFSYTIEIGDSFVLPPERIPLLAKEFIYGVKGMVDGMFTFFSKAKFRNHFQKIGDPANFA